MKLWIFHSDENRIPTDTAPEPFRIQKRSYVFHFIVTLIVMLALDLKIDRQTDYGLTRVERLWYGSHAINSPVDYYFSDERLAEQIDIQIQDLRTTQFVLETYLDYLNENKHRPVEELVSYDSGDNKFYFGIGIIYDIFFSMLIAGMFYMRDRVRLAEELVTIQETKHTRLNVQLAAKVEESARVIEKLEALRNRLVEAQKLASIGRLSATLAHEIRNPLTIIKSSTEIVRDDLPRDSPSDNALQVIREEVNRMDRIISDLLNFARPKEPDLLAHDLKTIVRHWLPPVVEELEKYNIQLVPEFEGFNTEVIADIDQLYQVFLNILWNARDALIGLNNPHIFIRAEIHDAKFVRLSIRDTGIGMLQETLKQIREPFYTTKTQGTGLGIPVTMQLVEGMGGRVDIASELDYGTTVSIYLRRADAAVDDISVEARIIRAIEEELEEFKTPFVHLPRKES